MTQEMIDELLESVTRLLDDVKDIQKNSYYMDQLINQLELRVNNVEITIHSLEQNAQNLSYRLSQVLECMMAKPQKEIILNRAIS